MYYGLIPLHDVFLRDVISAKNSCSRIESHYSYAYCAGYVGIRSVKLTYVVNDEVYPSFHEVEFRKTTINSTRKVPSHSATQES